MVITPHIGVVLTDTSRRIIWVNQDFTHITGYDMSEVIGKKPNFLQGGNTDAATIEAVRDALNNKLPCKFTLKNYRKNNEEYTCTFVIYPIFNEKNEHTNFIAFEIDSNATDERMIPLLQLRDKYESSSLREADQPTLYIRLAALMHQEKMYLNPDLSLKELAVRLHTNTRYLSQVINTLSGFNLQHYINSFRIKEVKRKIESGSFQHLTLYGIAQQCGFKNKSTFYKVFREATGETPKDYVRKV
ncbi:MAG: hypothetical protein RLZZ292_252 [Bacteroidota bacterium]|jgi:PAS domain S-box-containing protein